MNALDDLLNAIDEYASFVEEKNKSVTVFYALKESDMCVIVTSPDEDYLFKLLRLDAIVDVKEITVIGISGNFLSYHISLNQRVLYGLAVKEKFERFLYAVGLGKTPYNRIAVKNISAYGFQLFGNIIPVGGTISAESQVSK